MTKTPLSRQLTNSEDELTIFSGQTYKVSIKALARPILGSGSGRSVTATAKRSRLVWAGWRPRLGNCELPALTSYAAQTLVGV